jgi:1-acyl-sn-glycerol-3-phosphate acyltransferase
VLYVYLVLSAIGDFLIAHFCELVETIADIWKPILIYPALFIACIVLHLVLFILYSLTIKKGKEVTDLNNSYRRFMLSSLKLFFQLAGVRIHVNGEEKIPKDGKYLFVSNHISVYDPMIAIMKFSKEKLTFVSKKENLEVPFAGAYMIKSGCLGLDRENNREAVKTINKAAQNIQDGVCAIGIYPEGWVNKSGEGLLPFRNGAFKIAKKAKVPIVVATIRNTRKINKNMLRRHTDVFIDILKVLPYDELSGLKTVEIGEKVYEIMSGFLHCSHIQKQ